METGTRSLRSVFRKGSCNDCPLAIIYLLVITSNSWLSFRPCRFHAAGGQPTGTVQCSLQRRSLTQRRPVRSDVSFYTYIQFASARCTRTQRRDLSVHVGGRSRIKCVDPVKIDIRAQPHE